MYSRQKPPVLIQVSPKKLSIHWGAFLLVVGLIILAAFGEGSGFSFVVYAFGGILLISWIWLSFGLRSLEVRRRLDDHAYFGQELTVCLNFHNRGFWPILWLRVDERLPIELTAASSVREVFSLLPREREQLVYRLSCWKRGYYSIGPLELQSGDFWGLFEGGKVQLPAQSFIVYPRIVQLTDLNLPSHMPEGVLLSPQRLMEDPSRAFGVRPYIAGDSLRKVDWKTTAVSNRLQVKRFQSSVAYDAHIFLNLNEMDYSIRSVFSATEMGITIAASLAFYLSGRRQAVGLTVFGQDPLAEKADFHAIPLGKGNAHLMQILELLARVRKFSIAESFIEGLPRAGVGLPWGTLAFVVSPSLEDGLFRVLVGMRRSGRQPVLVVTESSQISYLETEAKAKEIGVPCFRIEREQDFDVWRCRRSPFMRVKVG
jgi:uncharacterized protein (DUF58 family)